MAYKIQRFTGGDITTSGTNTDILNITRIGGVTVDFSALTSGYILKYNGVNVIWAPDLPLDSIRVARTPVNFAGSPFTATNAQHLLGVDTSGGAITINLPAGTADKTFIIKDETGNASTNNVTIDGDLAETIDGAATLVLNSPYSAVMLYWNLTQWSIF